jgi:hypothetical protein
LQLIREKAIDNAIINIKTSAKYKNNRSSSYFKMLLSAINNGKFYVAEQFISDIPDESLSMAWHMLNIAFLKANQRIKAKHSVKTMHLNGFKITPELFELILIDHGFNGDEDLIERNYQAVRNQNLNSTCTTLSKMYSRLAKKDFEGLISEFENSGEGVEHNLKPSSCHLYTHALAERGDAEAIDAFFLEKKIINYPSNPNISLARALAIRSLNINELLKCKNFTDSSDFIEAHYSPMTISDINHIIASMIYAYDNSKTCWPRSKIPNEIEYFNKVLTAIEILLQPNGINENLESKDSDAILNLKEIFILINSRANKKINCFC